MEKTIIEQTECQYIVIRDIGDCIKLVQDTDVIVIEKSRIKEFVEAIKQN